MNKFILFFFASIPLCANAQTPTEKDAELLRSVHAEVVRIYEDTSLWSRGMITLNAEIECTDCTAIPVYVSVTFGDTIIYTWVQEKKALYAEMTFRQAMLSFTANIIRIEHENDYTTAYTVAPTKKLGEYFPDLDDRARAILQEALAKLQGIK